MATWANDALNTELPRAKNKPASDYLNFDSDSDSGQESEEEPTGEEPEGECTPQVHVGLCLALTRWAQVQYTWHTHTTLRVMLSGDKGCRKGIARCFPPATYGMSSPPTGVSPPGQSGHLTQPVFTEHVQYASTALGTVNTAMRKDPKNTCTCSVGFAVRAEGRRQVVPS